jgi:Sec-independent protein secretion pathway components
MVVLLLTIMLFGSRRIPEIARGLGKGIRDVRNATEDIKQEIYRSGEDEELRKFQDKVDKEKRQIEEIGGSVKRNLNP